MTPRLRAIAALTAGAALFAAAGGALSGALSADDALAQSRLVSYQLREGRYDLAPQSVMALEAAVQAYPKDVRLWNALGAAYFQQVTANFQGGRFQEIPALLVKARDAHAKALSLAPDDPDALSGHGTALAIISGFTRRPELGRQGMAELDRAVALAPDNTLVRLQRGFTSLGVGPSLWDTGNVEADLKRLITISDGSKSGDALHVILGDLYFETGKPDLARAEYTTAARAGSISRDLAEGRLQSLEAGVLPTADIARLRNDIGRQCTMCHGG